MLSLEGRVLGGCKLIRKIGEGGMGEVYLGEQLRVGNRLVAVKIVQPGAAAMTSDEVESVERRFQREAALLGQFSNPNILPVHDSGVEDGLLYLVMQYAPDGSLADAIKGRSAHPLALPTSLSFATDIIGQIASALQYTHERGVVHRDVKPGNVLIRIEPDGHWHALLADFGVARPQESASQRTQVTGTFAYMAPEQFSGKFSPASDQYALAVMAFQLLAGRTPFEGDLATLTHGHMYDPPPSLRALNPRVPAAVEVVIARGLAKEPAQRYPSVAAFAQALQDAARQGALSATGVPLQPASADRPVGTQAAAAKPTTPGKPPAWPLPPPEPRGTRLWRTWVAVLAAVVLLGGVVGASGIIGQRQQQAAAQQTRTAQTAAAGNTAATAQAHAKSTQVAQTAIAATATASFVIPTATATSTIGGDMTSPPPPPAGVGASVLNDPAPTCDQPAGPTWKTDNLTTVTCNSSGYPTITAQSTTQSACIEQQDTTLTDGYVSAIASPQSGGVMLGFREGAGASSGGTTNTTGYLYKVDRTHGNYGLFALDAAGNVTTVKGGALPASLAADFAISALFQGNQITLYINGQQIDSVTDSTFSQGWISLCTDGVTTYRDAQAYKAGS